MGSINERGYDFFISYNSNDLALAEWIAWILEDAGYKVFIQAWDFRPGNNFILEMQKGATLAHRTIALLSENYLNSGFTQPEWAAAFRDDPSGERRKLITVRIQDIQLPGLLPQIIYIDLVGLEQEDAKKVLLEGVSMGRKKPEEAPAFPGVIPKKLQGSNLPNSNSKSLVEEWYKDRIDSLILNEKNPKIMEVDSGMMVVHLIPLESFTEPILREIKLLKKLTLMAPLYSNSWDNGVNKDGYLTFSGFPNEKLPHSYVQFFRNGIIESVDVSMLIPRNEGNKVIPATWIEKAIIDKIQNYYLIAQKNIDIKLPIYVKIAFINLKGYCIPNYFGVKDIIHDNLLELPDAIITSYDENIGKLLKPSFDFLWNCAGYEGSPNYDRDVNWQKRSDF